jgi:8-oxo-dGTP pyrophosphatase MutT (NUDIX family)
MSTAVSRTLQRRFRTQVIQCRRLTRNGGRIEAGSSSSLREFSSSRSACSGDDGLSPHSNYQFRVSSRQFSSSIETDDDSASNDISSSSAAPSVSPALKHQRIWLPESSSNESSSNEPLYWLDDVVSDNPTNIDSLLERIEKQELDGGRMQTKQYGVLHEDPVVDMRLLQENYTVTSLASALRDREDVLQHCAQLAESNNITALKAYLHNFHPNLVLERRKEKRGLDVSKPLNATSMETIRKALMRMPRRVTQAHSRRAGVVICICHVDGVPSLLLEKRATSLRAHPDEVCLPGGMVCSAADKTIVETCLREMKEEIGGLEFDHNINQRGHGVNVLGVLRCNWGEVHHLVGVAVTPVVCVLGQDLAQVDLKPNPDEVAEVFTIPLSSLMDKSQWIYKDEHAPIFVGGPYIIWGLTGYILERFWKDILLPHNVKSFV